MAEPKRTLPLFTLIAAIFQSIEVAALATCFVLWTGFGVLPNSLILTSMFLGIPLTLAGAAAYGLWRRCLYGWWLSVVGNIFALAVLVISGIQGLQSIVTAIFVTLPIILLFLPQSRDFLASVTSIFTSEIEYPAVRYSSNDKHDQDSHGYAPSRFCFVFSGLESNILKLAAQKIRPL
jgi:hypothetical protein